MESTLPKPALVATKPTDDRRFDGDRECLNVIEAAPANAPDSTTITAPEQAAPPKKTTKHHASSKKNASFTGIGSIFRRMFASHGGLKSQR